WNRSRICSALDMGEIREPVSADKIMIGSWDTENLSSPEHFADLAHAYLDCGILLCSEMSKKSFSATFSRGRVVLFLSLHSVELFLKDAILKRSPSVAPNTTRSSRSSKYL